MNTIAQKNTRNKSYIRKFAGWLVPPDKLKIYIADYVRDKPINGDAYRYRWLVNKGYLKQRKQQTADNIQLDDKRESIQRFVQHLPRKARCANHLSDGLIIRSAKNALMYSYIQHNGIGMIWTLVFDLDYDVTEKAWANLPPPNLLAKTKETGRAHVFYNLNAGICTTQAARLKPIKYAAAIQRAYTEELAADKGYAGLICKNPLHARWETTEFSEKAYTLGELAAAVDLKSAPREYTDTQAAAGLGRNCTLFEIARKFAYREIKEYFNSNIESFFNSVLNKCEQINSEFAQPLGFSEVKATAKSIAKYTHRHFSADQFAEIQAARGRKATNQKAAGTASGQARRIGSEQDRATARLMRAKGCSYREIAAELTIDVATAHRWLKP